MQLLRQAMRSYICSSYAQCGTVYFLFPEDPFPIPVQLLDVSPFCYSEVYLLLHKLPTTFRSRRDPQ